MSSSVRRHSCFMSIVIFFVTTPFTFLAADPNAMAQQPEPESPEFELHEWGVFTAPRNSTWLKQDMLVEWSSFPEFFHGHWPRKQLAYRGPVTKPVIYLHSKKTFDMRLEIQFADGRPLIWWPPAELPNDGGWGGKPIGRNKKADADSFLQFQLRVNDGLERQRKLPSSHWMQHLRKVQSAPVRSHNGYSQLKSHYETREQEQFVYYDGVMKTPAAPSVVRIEDGIRLQTNAEHDLLEVFAIERGRGTLRFAASFIDCIKAGKNQTDFQWSTITPNLAQDSIHDLSQKLVTHLVDAGLNEDEADALLAVWGDGLLNRNGLTVFYRVPQKTYEQWLPLTCIPKAKKTVRVGLIVHYHLEPELEENVNALIKQLGSQKFNIRSSAEKELRDIGGAAFPFLEKELANLDPEIRARCKQMLKVKDLESKLEKLMKRHEDQRKR